MPVPGVITTGLKTTVQRWSHRRYVLCNFNRNIYRVLFYSAFSDFSTVFSLYRSYNLTILNRQATMACYAV